MKIKEFDRLAREHLLPYLPGFKLKKGLIFALPIEYLLRAITYQTSAFTADDFYVSAYVQALYVPNSESGILGARSPRWTRGVDSIEQIRSWVLEEGLPVLEGVRSPAELIARLEERERGHPPDVYAVEAIAYSLVLVGDYAAALQGLDEALTIAARYIQERADLFTDTDEEDWLIGVADRIKRVRVALASDPTDTVRILNQWRQESATNLGLAGEISPD